MQFGEQGDDPVLFLDRREDVPQLRLIGEFRRRRHLRRAFNIDALRRALPQHCRIAQDQRIARKQGVLLLFLGQPREKIGANRLEQKSRVMVVQIFRRVIEILLAERLLGTNHFVPRVAARRNQHDDDASIRQQDESDMLQHGLRDGRRHHDPKPFGDFRQHVPGALGYFLARRCPCEFAANPFLIFRAERGPAPQSAARKTGTPMR